MKIQIASDFHLEHRNNIPVFDNAGADVLILAGDICQAEWLYNNPADRVPEPGMSSNWRGYDAARFRQFFKHCSDNWRMVLYVSGNHEHYDGRWERTTEVLRTEMAAYHNIRYMDQDCLFYEGVKFLGVPLWTDFKNADPNVMWTAKSFMSDYRWIKHFTAGQWGKLRPQDTLEKHRSDVEYLRHWVEIDKSPTVVIGHHAPSLQSIHEMYKNQAEMNYAFCSDLDQMMWDHDQIRLWVHGHVHNAFDYQVNQTRVVCNPLGYPGESNQFNPELIVEI